VIDLPPAAQAILRRNESDKLFFRVLGSDGHLISGDTGLPTPSTNLAIDTPTLVTAKVFGREMRLVEIKVHVEDSSNEPVIVQVAEMTKVRALFQEKILLSIIVPQLLLMILGSLAVWYGVAKILTPLKFLQQQVTDRSQSDLSPLSGEKTPEEVYPLVKALNNLLGRVQQEHELQHRFIANAAHQLRTPLAGMKTYSSIGTQMSQVDDLRHVVRELDQGIDRATRIVTQLLALARTDTADSALVKAKSNVDLNFLVSDVVAALIETAVRKNVDLTFEPAPESATVYGEQSGLTHLVTNLIENAISYTPAGGEIQVRLRRLDQVVLSVSDTGCGIPLVDRANVFERFYRVSGSNGNGSGLGLAIVQEVAMAHNATVAIEEGLSGTGTTFLVEFPRAK